MADDCLSGAGTDFAEEKPTSGHYCLCEMALDVTVPPETVKQAEGIAQRLLKNAFNLRPFSKHDPCPKLQCAAFSPTTHTQPDLIVASRCLMPLNSFAVKGVLRDVKR
jgi:hypothetical protein